MAHENNTPVLDNNTSSSDSSVGINQDGTEIRESEATVSVDDGMGKTETTSVSLSDSDTSGVEATDATDTMNGSGVEATDATDTMNGSGVEATDATDTMNGSGVEATDATDTINGSDVEATDQTDTINGSDVEATGTDTMNGSDVEITDQTDTMNGSDVEATDQTDIMNGSGVDATDATDTMNGSGVEANGTIPDLTNISAPPEDISKVRQAESESSLQQSLIIGSFINNGSFEGSSFEPEPGNDKGTFQNWRTIGDTSIETREIGIAPTDGESQALITNGFSDSGGSVEESDLSEFLDLTSGSLDALLEGDATEGSGIKQTFTALAGDILEFDYTFLTNEATPSATYNDSAFFALGNSVDNPFEDPITNPVGNPVRNFALELDDTFDPTFSDKSVKGYSEATDTQTIRIAISEAGTYELGFGIVDLTDPVVDSGILIDDVKLIPIGVDPFGSQSTDGSAQTENATVTPSVNFTFGNNGFEPAIASPESSQ